jgi:hypothetical protein
MPKKTKSDKPKPTSPAKWNKALAEAESKYKVHPSAYSNSYAAKRYKEMGGGWR